MVRPIRTISPQKEVRRSERERTLVYRSLAENQLGSNSNLDDAIHYGRSSNENRRSERLVKKFVDFSDEDEQFDTSNGRRTRNTRTYPDDEENSPLVSTRPKRRKIIFDEESDSDSQPQRASLNSTRSSLTNGTSHDSKTRSKRADDPSPASLRETRHRNRDVKKVLVGAAEDEGEEGGMEEDTNEVSEEGKKSGSSEEEEEKEQRPYQLRQRSKPPPLQRFEGRVTRSFKRPCTRQDRIDARNDLRHQEKQRRSDYKRRLCRSDSSSTGSEDNREVRRKGGRQNDEERFERRKDASMMKARNRFVPINLTDKDLHSSQNLIRERMRQTGASCTDVDPMAIDSSIGFQEIGGLGSHIQSLKEVVLFPLLYPDVFQNFNINAPKGVLFYGPPGTGKTLVARALANECSRGNKKVAFFMRKGADCLSKWVGESERQLRILFDQAYAMRPSIIFFDEIDGLAPVRSTRQDQIHSSIVSTLLALMDGLDNRGEVIVIGATNRLDSIDPALRRPGRFDRELRFSLPDSAARLQILKIHTSKWGDSTPDDELMRWIANNTSGYCGADLKYLCTESVMISLRNHYPHIYLSNERLKLNLNEIKVTKENLLAAMKRITPASRRDLSIPCRPLDSRTSILLSGGLENLLKCIPPGYRFSKNVEVTGSCELEKVVRGLDEPPPISAARMILVGNPKCHDSGQTSYVLPALLSQLDHLPVHCISIGKLFADGRPEEAFACIFQAALRSSAMGPCILLCPSIDEWFKIVPSSVIHMLKVALDQVTGFTPIFFLATAESDYDSCAAEVTRIFRAHASLQIPLIPVGIRTQYFKFICAPALTPPKIFDEPEKATNEDAPLRKLSEKEAKELEKMYENQLREFRIFLRDQLGKLSRDRRFTYFTEPVDEEDAEDYGEIIKEPMCFTQMQEKVDRREYTHPDQFLGDIQKIVDNALEYNPVRDLHSKNIRHSATSLKDIVEEYFEKEFDEEFVEKLEETARLLSEAKIVPQNEQLLCLPEGFVRKTKWSVVTGFKGSTNNSLKMTPPSLNNSRVRMFRGSTYNFPSNKAKQKSRDIVKSIAESLTTSSDQVSETASIHTPLKCSSSTSSKSSPVEEKLNIDETEVHKVIAAAILKTNEWPIPELETLTAGMSAVIEKYRNEWNRRQLPGELMAVLDEWDYESQSSSRRVSHSSQ